MGNMGRLLVVDDEKAALANLQHVLAKAGYEVACAQSGQAAMGMIDRECFDVVLTDLRMERVDGMQVLRHCRDTSPGTEVIMVTGYATVDTAVDAMRHGAFSYIAKPYRMDEVRRAVGEAMDRVRRRQELAALAELKAGDEALLTGMASLKRLLHTARQVAPLDCPLLIVGPPGSGRRALARHVHKAARGDEPFQVVRCSAAGPAELEGQLFHSAPGGSLLLEEIELLPPDLQARLAMALDFPGGDEPRTFPHRLMVSTAADLDALAREGRFRADLLLLVKVVTLTVPALAQRKEDIPALTLHFLARAAAEAGRAITAVSDDALELLAAYDYPGNLRELDTVIHGAVALCEGDRIEAAHLPPSVRSANSQARSNRLQTLEERERAYILWVLEEVNGNQTAAARVLGIDRASLWRKLKRYEAAEEVGA